MVIEYKCFSEKSMYEKILLIEDFFQDESYKINSSRKLIRFFEDILFNETDTYLKKISLETMCKLGIQGNIRISSIVDALFDMDTNEDTFILIQIIKYLYLYKEKDEKNIINKLRFFSQSDDLEVASEAYFRLGLIYLIDSNDDINENEFIKNISNANNYFKYSVNMIENRTDAKYYLYITEFIKGLFSEDKNLITKSFNEIQETIWSLKLNLYEEELEYKIYITLIKIKKIYETLNDYERWIDFYKEFQKLSIYNYELSNIGIVEGKHYEKYLESFKKVIEERFLKFLYQKKLVGTEEKVKRLINDYGDSDEILKIFLEKISDLDIKKKDLIRCEEDLGAKLAIIELVPKEFRCESIIKELDSINTNDICQVVKFLSKYRTKEKECITGFGQGEEIFKKLSAKFNDILPNYDKQNKGLFLIVLELIIRYMFVLSREGKKYLFLFSEKEGGKGGQVKEKELQESIYEFFLYSNYAYMFKEERPDFADGGRIDIEFNNKSFKIPIELKKTNIQITKDRIKKDYLNQVSSYVYSYNNLGIFILLDLNPKDKVGNNNLSDLIYFEKLDALHDMGENNNNYALVVIITGNKVTPTKKSNYR